MRRKMGPLGTLVVEQRTARRYWERVKAFFQEQKKLGRPPVTTALELDREVSRALKSLWWEGEPKQWAADLLSGMQHFYPRARKNLPEAWRLFGAWCRKESTKPAAPMTKEVALGVAGQFWDDGLKRTAVLMLVGHHCYMRTGELLKLRRRTLR